VNRRGLLGTRLGKVVACVLISAIRRSSPLQLWHFSWSLKVWRKNSFQGMYLDLRLRGGVASAGVCSFSGVKTVIGEWRAKDVAAKMFAALFVVAMHAGSRHENFLSWESKARPLTRLSQAMTSLPVLSTSSSRRHFAAITMIEVQISFLATCWRRSYVIAEESLLRRVRARTCVGHWGAVAEQRLLLSFRG
jgi:hypothetical protein